MRARLFRVARLLWLAPLAASLQGCYVARAAYEEARILAARKPIARLVNDRSVPDSTREKLRLVLAARRFAAESLGLDPGKSFTTFSDIGRDTLVLVLSAARRDTLAGYTWSYPVVGTLPYRGFFELRDALREARDLEATGHDTYLRTADAFSTLGWFDDPLLSTTLRRDSLQLANTVFHEITHSTYFAKGQAVFNESFASFVGSRGAEHFFRSRGSVAAAAMSEAYWEDSKLLSVFWSALSSSLDSAFAAHPRSREARLRARDTVFASARRSLIEDVAPRLRTISPRYAERVPLDNAFVLAQVVYARELELFDQVYEIENRDLRAAIRRVIALAKSARDEPFRAIRKWVSSVRE